MTDNRLPCALQWTFPLFLLYIQADGLISEAHTCPADVDAAWSSMRSIPLQAISTRRQELALMPSAPLLEQGHFVRDYVLVELVTVLGTHGRWEESECFAPGFRSTLGAGPARQQLQHFPPLQLSAPEQVSRDSTTDLARVAKVHASTNDVIGTQSTTSAVPISDRYELGQRFARGSHGEVWRAERRRQHAGQDSAGTSAGVSGPQAPGTSSTSGDQRPQERESYVMKRMLLKTSLAVAQCGRREVYFGQKLRGQRRVARFVEHFFVWHDETNAEDSSNDDDGDHDQHSRRETANADELWLVFRDEGLSLRHHLYTLQRSVGSVLYVPSKFWHEMRHSSRNSAGEGAVLMRELLRQLVEAVHELHAAGVTHRDLKPSNLIVGRGTELRLTIADFGSAVDDTSIESMYGVTGPSRDEASLEYAPPEVLLEPEPERSATKPAATPTVQSPIPYYAPRPSSYDMWSIGVIWLEMILGTTQIFEPEPRARVILEQHLSRARASDAARRNFMLLAAMADFCIWTDGHRDAWRQSFWKRWPKKQHQSRNDVVLTRSKEREPLQHLALAAAPSVQAPACDVHEFNRTLRRRDPLDIGLPDRWALDLLWRLLRFDPTERISAQEALDHAYLRTEGAHRALDGTEHATQAERAAHDAMMRAHKLQHRRRRSQNYTLREANATEVVPPIMMKDDGLHKMLSFCCPKCGRCFADWESCHAHVRGRRHAHFCDYNATNLLPLCMSAHALMMHDPHSGWCDLQGRRPYMEDFHSLYYSRAGFTMYGVFDGHSGTRAAKFAASSGAGSLFRSIEASIGQEIALSAEFKDNSSRCAWSLSDAAMEQALVRAFNNTQHAFVQQLQQQRLLGSSGDNSGSTATVALLFPNCDDSTRMARLVVANVGDSRAVLCCGSDFAARSSQHVVMSVDHSPALQIERERIESGGGFVSGIGQGGQGNRRSARSIARLMGQLAVSRSIGDIQLDAHLSRRPTVRERKIQQHDRFLIVATDGLWDVVGSDEAVEMVLETIGPRRSVTSRTSVPDETRFQRAALRLSREAFVRGSSDNIGVFVLDLETRA